MSEIKIKPPNGYMVIVVLAILWNFIGCVQYLLYTLLPPELLASDSVEMQEFIKNTPIFINVMFALSVWGGLLGCIGLAMKKTWSTILLLISLGGIIIQKIYNYFFTDMITMTTLPTIVIAVVVIFIAVYLVLLSYRGKAEKWLT